MAVDRCRRAESSWTQLGVRSRIPGHCAYLCSMRAVSTVVLLGATLLVLACSRGDRLQVDTARSAASAPASAPQPTPAATPGVPATSSTPKDSCPKWGDWQICSVEDRLTRAGLVLERDPKPVRHDFMSVPGVRYSVSKAEVQVFVYPSGAARARDTDVLDTVTVAPRGKQIIWPEPATLVTAGNLAAIILSVNARQAERIALALGAGLPPHPP